MGVVFELLISVGSGFCSLLGSFTLGDSVVLGGLLFLTSTLVCVVSLWVGSCVGFFIMSFPTLGNYPQNRSSHSYVICLKIRTKFLAACNFISPMDENGSIGSGFTIASMKSSDVLVAASWLDTPGILLWSEVNSTVSEIRSALVLLTYTVCNLYCSKAGSKYHPSTPCGSQYFCCPGFLCITTLVPRGVMCILLK